MIGNKIIWALTDDYLVIFDVSVQHLLALLFSASALGGHYSFTSILTPLHTNTYILLTVDLSIVTYFFSHLEATPAHHKMLNLSRHFIFSGSRLNLRVQFFATTVA